ncbi:hypothetical protein TRFO_01794 [Tritrichomonas foetus]|uniref:Uncharacterized protein n=1 Tax=Tritrichomonas foetus TaxID=1144522 RepID=A0A1J4JHW4_9EUKA|nr:hypothetical protein TRFO_01794 [Tritrichomonas foetus]|eukprot:OHS98760.1 hypothetical protein TRFO_01794 [Tritrichomonas foetus]
MLKFEEIFNSSANGEDDSSETRLIGETTDSYLILSTIYKNQNKTVVRLFLNSNFIDLITFENKKKNFINGDISSDHRFLHLCHFVEAPPRDKNANINNDNNNNGSLFHIFQTFSKPLKEQNSTKIKEKSDNAKDKKNYRKKFDYTGQSYFESVVYDIFTKKKSKKFKFNEMINGVFFPSHHLYQCEMLHVVGSRITHVLVQSHNELKHLQIDKVRGGFHLPNMVYWQFFTNLSTLFAIYQTNHGQCSNVLTEFHFSKPTNIIEHSNRMNNPLNINTNDITNNSLNPILPHSLSSGGNDSITSLHLNSNLNKIETSETNINNSSSVSSINSTPNTINHSLSASNSININNPNNSSSYSIFQTPNFQTTTSIANEPIHIQLHPKSVLPPSISLHFDYTAINDPTTSNINLNIFKLPFYRCNSKDSTFFVAKYHAKTCFVQQIFQNKESCISFNVSCYPKFFNRNFSVPGVNSTLPLSFLQQDSILFVFVPNCFVCLIDFSTSPPNVSLLPKEYATTYTLSSFSASTNFFNNKYLINLDNSTFTTSSLKVYKVSIDFSSPNSIPLLLPIINRTSWDAFANICARIHNPSLLASVFNFIVLLGDYRNANTFIHDLFLYCCYFKLERNHSSFSVKLSTPQRTRSNVYPKSGIVYLPERRNIPFNPEDVTLDNKLDVHDYRIKDSIKEIIQIMNEEFPSASRVTRKHMFKKILNFLITKKRYSKVNQLAHKAIELLKRQNDIVIYIQSSFNFWKEKYSPNSYWQFIISFLIQNETHFNNFPNVPQLKEELNKLLKQSCSTTLQTLINYQLGIFNFPMNDNANPFFQKYQFSDDIYKKNKKNKGKDKKYHFQPLLHYPSMTRTRSSDLNNAAMASSDESWNESIPVNLDQ